MDRDAEQMRVEAAHSAPLMPSRYIYVVKLSKKVWDIGNDGEKLTKK